MAYLKSEHADNLITNISTYGDTFAAYYATAEIAYYHQYGKLPEWACYIEKIEEVRSVDGEINYIYVHRDPAAIH